MSTKDDGNLNGCDDFLVRQSAKDCFYASTFIIIDRIRKHQLKQNDLGFLQSEIVDKTLQKKRTCQMPITLMNYYRVAVSAQYYFLMVDNSGPCEQTFHSIKDVDDNNKIWQPSHPGLDERILKLYFRRYHLVGDERFLDGGMATAMLLALLWEAGVATTWAMQKLNNIFSDEMAFQFSGDYDLLPSIQDDADASSRREAHCIVVSWVSILKYKDLLNTIRVRNLYDLLNGIHDNLSKVVYPNYKAVAVGIGIKGRYCESPSPSWRHAFVVSPCEGGSGEWLICDPESGKACVRFEEYEILKKAEECDAELNVELIDFVLMRDMPSP